MKKCAVLMVALLVIKMAGAQPFKASVEDLKAMMQRTLAVELRDLNRPGISAFEKERDQLYNDALKKAVDKYWKINATIEYKTTGEMDKIMKGKNAKYVCLCYLGEVTGLRDENRNLVETLGLPCMTYWKAENKKPDYSFYIPEYVGPDKPDEATSLVMIRFMNDHIKYMVDKNVKLEASDYVEKCAEANCGQLKSKTLLVDGARLTDRATESEIKSNYPHAFKMTNSYFVSEAIKKEDESAAFIVAIPYKLRKVAGRGGNVGTSTTYYMRVVMSAKDGAIMSVNGTKALQRFGVESGLKDFKEMAECK